MSGPRITVNASCSSCEYVRTSHYAVQGDSGCNVSCSQPEVVADNQGKDRYVGDTTWDTPMWCPMLTAALSAKARDMTTPPQIGAMMSEKMDYRSTYEIEADEWARTAKTSVLVQTMIDREFDRRNPDLIRFERSEARWDAAMAELDRRMPVPT